VNIEHVNIYIFCTEYFDILYLKYKAVSAAVHSHYRTVQISLLLHAPEKVVTDRQRSLEGGDPTCDRKNFSLLSVGSQ